MYNIHLLPASFGDSILIEYGSACDLHYILIDGGVYYQYDEIIASIKEIAPDLKTLELVVVTHIDIDHLDGIAKMLNQNPLPFRVKEIWFNGWKQLPEQKDVLGAKHGEFLSALIEELNIPHNTPFDGKAVMVEDELPIIDLPGGMQIKLLSPNQPILEKLAIKWEDEMNKAGLPVGDTASIFEYFDAKTRYKDEPEDVLGDNEMDINALAEKFIRGDNSIANISSIAFVAEYEGKSCLFAGDAPSRTLKEAFKKFDLLNEEGLFPVDAWKLAHHGSKKSTLQSIVDLVDTKRMLISSDGKRFKHPDAELIAKLVQSKGKNLELHFNYRSKYTEIWDDEDLMDKYEYTCFFEGKGLCLSD